jgi:hypothetical protein
MMIKVRQSKDLPYTKEEIEEIAREALPSELSKAKGTIIIDWRSWPGEGDLVTWRSAPGLWHIAIQKKANNLFLSDEPLIIKRGSYTEFGYDNHLEHETGRDLLAGALAHEFTHIKQGMDALDRNSPKYEYYHKNFPRLDKIFKNPQPPTGKMKKTVAALEREADRESRRTVEKEFWGRKKLRA